VDPMSSPFPHQQKRSLTTKRDAGGGSHGQIALLSVLILIVCAAVLAGHWTVLRAGAVSFDDREYLFNNPTLQDPS